MYFEFLLVLILPTVFLPNVLCDIWGQRLLQRTNNSPDTYEYTFHPTTVSWFDAFEKCRSNGSELLCFKDKEEIRGLLDSTLNLWRGLEVWIGKRDCYRASERWLYVSINIYDSGLEDWNFRFSRDKRLWFICKKTISTPISSIKPPFPTGPISTNIRCPETKRRDLLWPRSPGNSNVRLECPNGKTGFAHWFCDIKTGQWSPENPDLSDCHNVAMTAVLKNIELIDVAKTTRELSEMVQSLKYGGEVSTAVDILDKIDDVYFSQAHSMSPAEKLTTVTQASNDILSTCDKLIEVKEAWKDLPKDKRTDSATKLLTAVDETGFLLASSVEDIDRSIDRNNIVLHISKHTNKKYSTTHNLTFHRMSGFNKTGGKIILPVPPNQNKPGDKEEMCVVFAWFSDLNGVLPTEQATSAGPTESDSVKVVNTAVVSANISGRGFKDKLPSGQAIITLQHFNQEARNPQCSFWDIEQRLWSTAGCKLLETNESHTTCVCNHLTNFAVLMDINCVMCELSSAHKLALSIVSMTGCVVSVFCLSICIVIFSWYRSLWGIRTTIHRNLCIALWFAEVILLVGLDRTENKVLCGVIAGALHYFFLTVFFWMLLEGIHILILLVKVFTPKRMHVAQYYVIGYGCPAVIVGITAGMRSKDYGNDYYCWLSTSSGAIWSFLGPVILIIAFNTLALGKALWTTHILMKSKEKLPFKGFKMWVRGSAVLLPLLGLTWITGFLYFDTNTIALAYIFAVLNSLQGLGIFIFQVVLNKKVKQLVSRSFQRASFSRSGTTRTTKSSSSSFRSWASSKKKKKPDPNSITTPSTNSPPDLDLSDSPSDDTPKVTNDDIQPRVLFASNKTPEKDIRESDDDEDVVVHYEEEQLPPYTEEDSGENNTFRKDWP